MKMNFGDIVRDIVTKVEGIIIGHAEYVTGCDTYLVQPVKSSKKDKTSRPDSMWFDENRLEVIGEDLDTKSIKKEKTGADLPAPKK